MEHTDVELLQSVPVPHLQAVFKARNVSARHNQGEHTPSSFFTPTEMAHILFERHDLLKILHSLDAFELQIIQELVACGGHANSRDLAFYFATYAAATEQIVMPPTGHAPAHELSSVASSRSNALPGLSHVQLSTGGVPPQYPAPHPHGPFEQAIRHLLLLGLLFWRKQTAFASSDYASGMHDGVLIVPQTVQDIVLDEWGEKQPFVTFIDETEKEESQKERKEHVETLETPVPVETPGNAIEDAYSEGMRHLQRKLYLYWSLVASQHDGLALVSTGLLSRAALRLVVEHVASQETPGLRTAEQVRLESDAPYLLFLRLLLMHLGLLRERNNAIVAVNAAPFFSLPLIERARRCYNAWYSSTFWNEMLYLPDVNVRPGPSPLDPAHEEVLRGRQVIIERLEHEQLNEWHSLSVFIARTKLYSPQLLFPRQYGSRTERYTSGNNPYGWDFRLKRGWLTPREGWHMVEGGFIRSVITGPLYWIGLIELSSEEMPTAFCLTTGSRLLLTGEPLPDSTLAAGRLIVQPNFELVALAPVSEALLIALDRFADRVSLEHIAQYRLSKASVTRAIQSGLHAEDIQHTLEESAGGDIPQNIHYSLIEWERQARRIEVWPDATLLEVDDEAFLDALFASEETRPFLRRRLTPRLAEVVTSQLEKLQEILWQRDYLPPVVSTPTDDVVIEQKIEREPQWYLHQDGLLEPLYAVTDLYLLAALERFSTRDTSTGWWRITAESLQRALGQGLTLDTIISFLNKYCRSDTYDETGIPSSFLIRLKLWGNGYGEQHSIAVEHAPLLRLSEEILNDLLADDEIAMLLNGEVAQHQRLVRVQPHDLERIIALLQKRGFSLEQ